MNFNVIATEIFERKLKKISKKHKSLKADLFPVIQELIENPTFGTPLGKECYKIWVAVASKGKGKLGGASLITYVRILKKTVFLLDIYDKSEQSTISDKELKLLINLMAEN